jgi:hypothetical protein
MENNMNKYYDDGLEGKEIKKSKRKPKIKTEEEIKIENDLKEKRKKINIIKNILYVLVTMITVSIIFIQVRTVENTDFKAIKLLKDTEIKSEILNEKTKNKEYTKNIESLERRIEQYKKSEIAGEKVPEVLEKELEETKMKLRNV